MKKSIKILLSLSLSVLLIFAGCAKRNQNTAQSDSSVKTGMAIISSAAKSKDAGDTDGLAQVDTMLAAVTVDKDGKIVKCVLDAVQAKINFSKEGKLATSLDTQFKTKLELGTEYGMKKASKIGKEWSEQAEAFAKYAQGKTVEQLKGIAVNEEGAPTTSELTSSVTISIKDFVDAVAKAVNNAKDLGAKDDDKLGIGALTTIDKSKNATADAAGLAQSYSSVVAATFDSAGKITSCIIDSVQGNINFSNAGKITSDINTTIKTKNELGTDYGMGKVSSIGKEWFAQAESLAKYLTGKTVAQVKGISVSETGAPTDAELKSSVTISIKPYMTALEKAQAMAR